jgi:hypothetical protein
LPLASSLLPHLEIAKRASEKEALCFIKKIALKVKLSAIFFIKQKTHALRGSFCSYL